MRVVKISPLKRLITVVPETTLDLLNLYRVLEIRDMVYALTSREIKKERRNGSVDSERVKLEIGVELLEKELNPLTKRLTLRGVIKYESRDLGLVGKHHSIHLAVGEEVTVESRKNYPRLESMASYYRGTTAKKAATLVLVDDESLSIYVMSLNNLNMVYRKTVSVGKDEPEYRAKTVSKIYAEAVDKIAAADNIYVFGPSIIVEGFINFVKKENKQLVAKIKSTGYVSSTDEGGVSEILRNKNLHELRDYIKTVADVEEVEELLEKLAKEPSRVALGLRESLAAFNMKAVEKFLIAEDFLWSNIVDESVEQLLERAETHRVVVRVISLGSEAAEKLTSLGGVACILRFAIEPDLLRQSGYV